MSDKPELVELKSINDDWKTSPQFFVPKSFIDETLNDWLHKFGSLSPEQADFLYRTMAFAIWEHELVNSRLTKTAVKTRILSPSSVFPSEKDGE